MVNLRLFERLAMIAPRFIKMWGLQKSSPEPKGALESTGWFFSEAYGHFEHVVHEMAHAEDLGLSIGPRLAQRVSDKFERMASDDDLREAQALAVEWKVLTLLRSPIKWEEFTHIAYEQGISERTLQSYLTGTPLARTLMLARKVVRRLKYEERCWVVAGRPGIESLPSKNYMLELRRRW